MAHNFGKIARSQKAKTRSISDRHISEEEDTKMRAPLIISTSILAALGYLKTTVVLAQPFYQPPQSTTVITTHGPSMGLVEELTGWSSQLSGIVKASPRCWTIAINALEDLMHVPTQSSTEFCAAMTQMQ